MDQPGYFSLGDDTVLLPSTGTAIGTGVSGFDGIQAGLFSLKWAPVGTLGTAVDAYVQSRLGTDCDWYDIAHASFGTAAATKLFKLTNGTSIGTGITPSAASLGANAAEPLLGIEFRLWRVSTGTFAAGSVLSGRMNAS